MRAQKHRGQSAQPILTTSFNRPKTDPCAATEASARRVHAAGGSSSCARTILPLLPDQTPPTCQSTNPPTSSSSSSTLGAEIVETFHFSLTATTLPQQPQAAGVSQQEVDCNKREREKKLKVFEIRPGSMCVCVFSFSFSFFSLFVRTGEFA